MSAWSPSRRISPWSQRQSPLVGQEGGSPTTGIEICIFSTYMSAPENRLSQTELNLSANLNFKN